MKREKNSYLAIEKNHILKRQNSNIPPFTKKNKHFLISLIFLAIYLIIILVTTHLILEEYQILYSPICGDNLCEPPEDKTSCPTDCSPFIISYWGYALDISELTDSVWSNQLLPLMNSLRDIGFTHAGVKIYSTNPSQETLTKVQARINDLRTANHNISLHQSPAHRFLEENLDPETHSSNGQNLKFFDSTGFTSFPQSNYCYRRGIDPAYTGTLWQQELNLITSNVQWANLGAQDIMVLDTELWGKWVNWIYACYPNVLANSVARYTGTVQEREAQYVQHWQNRGLDIKSIIKAHSPTSLVYFYGEAVAQDYDNTWMPVGTGDAPSPSYYFGSSIPTYQNVLSAYDHSGAYPWISFSGGYEQYMNPPISIEGYWNLALRDPLVTQKMGFLLNQEGARGAIEYPGVRVRTNEYRSYEETYSKYFLDHAQALVLGLRDGIDPGDLIEKCDDGWDNDGDGYWDENLQNNNCIDASGTSDRDGLPDWWELRYMTNLAQTPSGDFDSDSITNIQEFYKYGTNPASTDTDGDILPDGWEIQYNLDPIQLSGTTDTDRDGLINSREYQLSTNPINNDSDNDGLLDGAEITAGSNPLLADTDNDSIMDGRDCDPINPVTQRVQEICGDGIDNDCDKLTTDNSFCGPFTLSCLADLNADSKFTVADSNLLANHLGESDCAPQGEWCSGFDINRDGNVNNQDSEIISNQIGYSSGNLCECWRGPELVDLQDNDCDILIDEGNSCSIDSECEDNSPCTSETCNSELGHCIRSPTIATPDQDLLFCNGIESCYHGQIVHAGDPCDDEITCTYDECEESEDSCTNWPDDSACNFGSYCNPYDILSDAISGCIAGQPPQCLPAWKVGQWGSCTNNLQSRLVEDLNECGMDMGKPIQSRVCESNPNPPQNPEGGGGGGGGDGGGREVPVDCTPNWICQSWSICLGGTQTCSWLDTNNCGTQEGKPQPTRTCNPEQPVSPDPGQDPESNENQETIALLPGINLSKTFTYGLLGAIILISIMVILSLRRSLFHLEQKEREVIELAKQSLR